MIHNTAATERAALFAPFYGVHRIPSPLFLCLKTVPNNRRIPFPALRSKIHTQECGKGGNISKVAGVVPCSRQRYYIIKRREGRREEKKIKERKKVAWGAFSPKSLSLQSGWSRGEGGWALGRKEEAKVNNVKSCPGESGGWCTHDILRRRI